ncbi:UDP-N-acetylmuramoyl-L-alanine--D-glutamate ligase [Flaviaesturariibacter flavus]|uniref:UDP-N-acetylmuramoylalanine--D-glutamate ligase n=1 Tax=Flaviaesturariibacter flavus TaxID=2502780 RepID=A0A4R1BC18_9BACT|nr:UDP-N-acetylmuramoyl-L-alanine--D-glutamate ligase [Flaviaesturariibacter flavus]TCJ14517.1 UDP-N-acetylmuramoyl-L-alanine--D-glutamate ligase [Flaviaesturariibacter flavus]
MKRLVILGGGESGVGAALLARQRGYDVFLFDEGALKPIYKSELEAAGIPFAERTTDVEGLVLTADEVVKSPGIPEKNELVKRIRAKGIPVISEIELAYRYKGDSKIIAITGSNGKSTTTALIYHICKVGGLDCALVGNIGYSFAKQVAEDPKPLYVAEISSFQLDDIQAFRADVALLLNITEDHLDRYDYKFENYARSKFRIAMNSTAGDYFIYNADDEVIVSGLNHISNSVKKIPMSMKRKEEPGAYIQDNELNVNVPGAEQQQMSIYDFALKGKHNQFNTMAACVAGATMEIRKSKIREAVQTFQSLEHRMEPVATVRGVEFINDSKATNVNSTWYALESMTKPTVLILGGVDKGNDYGLIEELVTEKVKAIVCMGTDNSKIRAAFEGKVPVVETASAEAAVQAAYELSVPGDAVLLSPACASFDLFKNYEDRGLQFKQAVKNL